MAKPCCCTTVFRDELPTTGKSNVLYVVDGVIYQWNGSAFEVVSGSSKIELTLAANGSQAIPAGKGVDKIRVKSDTSLTALTIGTTFGGTEVYSSTITTGSPTWDLFQVNAFDISDYTLYFGGITDTTNIIIYTI